jgi:hypothetical protein
MNNDQVDLLTRLKRSDVVNQFLKVADLLLVNCHDDLSRLNA